MIHWDQKENSVFSRIFPHYILSFRYKGVEYFNPSIENCPDSTQCILNGFDIDQHDFIARLYKETGYEIGVMTSDYIIYSEQKKLPTFQISLNPVDLFRFH